MAAAGRKCLAEMDKALHSWVEAEDRNRVLTEGSVLHREAPSLKESSSKGPPETSELKRGAVTQAQE